MSSMSFFTPAFTQRLRSLNQELLTESFVSSRSATPDIREPDAGNRITPISGINLYQTSITVKGRVTSKTTLDEWMDDRGSGARFGFDIQDSTSEIHVISFNRIAKQVFRLIELDKVYTITLPLVRETNKRYTALIHPYQLAIGKSTVIEVAPGDKSYPPIQEDFSKLSDVLSAKPGDIVNVKAVIQRVDQVEQTLGYGVIKKDILLRDETAAVTLTLWETPALAFDGRAGNSVIIRKAKVDNFRGLYPFLTSTHSFCMEENPADDEAHRLRGWFLWRCGK